MCEEKKVFLCVGEDYTTEGRTLKEAYDAYADQQRDAERPEDLRFYEAVPVEVEVKLVKKEVVSKITAKK